MARHKVLRVVLFGVLAAGMTLLAPNAAGAVENPDYTAPPPPEVIETDPPVAISRVAAPAARSTQLPVTGADVTQVLLLGGGLIVIGGAMVAGRRRFTS